MPGNYNYMEEIEVDLGDEPPPEEEVDYGELDLDNVDEMMAEYGIEEEEEEVPEEEPVEEPVAKKALKLSSTKPEEPAPIVPETPDKPE